MLRFVQNARSQPLHCPSSGLLAVCETITPLTLYAAHQLIIIVCHTLSLVFNGFSFLLTDSAVHYIKFLFLPFCRNRLVMIHISTRRPV